MFEPNSDSRELAAFLLRHKAEIIEISLLYRDTHWEEIQFVKPGSEDCYIGCCSDFDNLISVLDEGVFSIISWQWVRDNVAKIIRLGANQKIGVDFWLQMKEVMSSFIWNEYKANQDKLLTMVSILDQSTRFLVSNLAQLFQNEILQVMYNERVQELILEERHRLSREIHDNLSQAFGLVKMKSSLAAKALEDSEFEQTNAYLYEIHELASRAYTDAREAIMGLRCFGNQNVAFEEILEEYLVRYRNSFGMDIDLDYDANSSVLLAPLACAQVFYIIQEALSNIRKHAYADKVSIEIQVIENCYFFVVRDNGRGFNPAAINPFNTSSVGLNIMYERAKSIGGELKIASTPGQGSNVTLIIPKDSE
jgi:signal transduction histidine kinase